MNTRPNRAPWIVVRGMPGEMLCERCSASYLPALPCSFAIYIAICQAFVRDHKHCKVSPPKLAPAIHILSDGRAYCGFPGMPGEWPEGQSWIAFNDDPARATCTGCRGVDRNG